MWIRFSGCAHKYTLTHIRGRDHREWGQGRGGPWGGNSDRNMHCFSLDWGKDHPVGPHMESRSEHLHWLWWGVFWRELDTPRLKWKRGGGGSSSRFLSKPLVPVDPVTFPPGSQGMLVSWSLSEVWFVLCFPCLVCSMSGSHQSGDVSSTVVRRVSLALLHIPLTLTWPIPPPISIQASQWRKEASYLFNYQLCPEHPLGSLMKRSTSVTVWRGKWRNTEGSKFYLEKQYVPQCGHEGLHWGEMYVPTRVMRICQPFTHLGIIIPEECTSVWTLRMCLSRDEARGSSVAGGSFGGQ